MAAFAIVAIIALGVLAYNGNTWIETYWKGRTEAAREERLATEAKITLARINAAPSRETLP